MKALLLLAALALPASASTVLVDLTQRRVHTEITRLDSGRFHYSYTFNQDQVQSFSLQFLDEYRTPPTLYNVQGASYTSRYDPHNGSMNFLPFFEQEEGLVQITFESDFAPEQNSIGYLYYMGTAGDLPGRLPTLEYMSGFFAPGINVPEPSLTLLAALAALPFINRRRR